MDVWFARRKTLRGLSAVVLLSAVVSCTGGGAETPSGAASGDEPTAEATRESAREPSQAEPTAAEPTSEPTTEEATEDAPSPEPTEDASSTEPTEDAPSAEPTTEDPAPAEPTEDGEPAEPTEEASSAEAPGEDPTEGAGAAGFGDGTYRMGTDIEPGTYRSEGSDLCYWARLSGFSGELDDIIANGNNSQAIVTITADDAGFETSGCGSWLPVEDTVPAEPQTSFGDATYQVGGHIEPGTYRSEDSDLCYWARLSGFSGGLDNILANGNNGPEIVAIAADDAGFETSGCGTWVPVEDTIPAAPQSSFGAGTYQVGAHIEPGSYRADGAADDLCYWARLSGFSGELDDIIANGNSPTVIEISPSDAGFTSSGCGTWNP